MPFRVGVPELIIILVIIIAVFGAGKLAGLGGALGKGVKEFRQATKELEEAKKDVEEATDLKDSGTQKRA